jgi:hypothetical protein
MKNILAERELISTSVPPQKVMVKLGQPEGAAGGDFKCNYQLIGPGVDVKRYSAGIDAFQAIQLSFVALGAEITVIEKKWGCRLVWLDGDAGFPRGSNAASSVCGTGNNSLPR